MSVQVPDGNQNDVREHAFDQNKAAPDLSSILTALNAIHDPSSTNETRRSASEHLEGLRSDSLAPRHGFSMAADRQQTPSVRHFGLSLMETSIRHGWYDLPQDHREALRHWCIELAQDIQDDDPQLVRAKLAQVWVELAKKCWALDWLDMDAYLLWLWGRNLMSRELVLSILETLSEDVFYREDSAAALRGNELNTALVEIFTSVHDLAGGIRIGEEKVKLRAADDGWLERLCRFLDSCTEANVNDAASKSGVIKALAAIRSVCSWIMPSAIVSARCLESVCMALTRNDAEILLASIEVLHALYARQNFEEHDFQRLINPMYQPENATLLGRLYEWSMVDCHDIDDTKYSVSKKFSETISFLCNHTEQRPTALLKEVDFLPFLQLTITVLRHPSLVVSIPVLHSWVKIWASPVLGDSVPVWSVVGELLETASQRIVRYEHYPDDCDDPVIVFLNEDIDTVPERHAFLGNYRRFCFQIIESIAERKPREAITHILTQMDAALDHWQESDREFDVSSAGTRPIQHLEIDARCTVVEAALRGYNRWVASRGKDPQQDERERASLETSLEEWGSDFLIRRLFRRPDIEQRTIKLALELSGRALPQNQGFALKVLEHLLSAIPKDEPDRPQFSESVKELHNLATNEMRRLTMRNADYFATFIGQIEAKVNDLLASWNMDEKAQAELHAVLFVIFQRATNIDMEMRQTRLEGFVLPIKNLWQDTTLTQSLSTFDGFCQFLGFDQVGPYLRKINAHRITDWSSVQIDDEGIQIQTDMTHRFSQLPFRATKSLLAASTEKLKKESQIYQLTVALWQPCFPAIIPNVLKLVSFAHQFNDRSTWNLLPSELQLIINRILMDRFWQAGISSGTKEDFYTKITSTKSTLEGFGSSVRGKLRMVRESCYTILYCISRLGDYLYSCPGLPEPLADALYGTSSNLSSHQFSVLLNMTRHLVDDCPMAHMTHFLPAMLSTLFTHLDLKLTTAWSSLDERKDVGASSESALSEEMKEESILRGLTYNAVMLITGLFDPQRVSLGSQPIQDETKNHESEYSDSLREFTLSNTLILEPLLRLSAHTLRMRDTRSCGIIVRVLQSIVPTFCSPITTQSKAETAHVVREFISTDVLQAAITSLNDNYFVDVQKDLALLIAKIWTAYGILPAGSAAATSPDQPLSRTPRAVLCSLPGLSPDKVDACAVKLGSDQNQRHQRAFVLGLLENIRGISISELGKIKPRVSSSQARRSAKDRYSSGAEGMDSTRMAQTGTGSEEVGLDLVGIQEIFG